MAEAPGKRDPAKGGQFALIPAGVLYDDQLPATAKLLYGEIYRLSHANGYCYASNQEFTRIVGCEERTVTRLISKLAARGHIRVKLIRRYGGRGDIVQRRIFCGQELAKEDPPEEAENESVGPDKNDETSCQNCLDGPDKNGDHTTKSKINNNTPIVPNEILKICTDYAGEDQALLKAILDLLENRAKLTRPKPVKTAKAMHGILNQLDRLSGGNRAVKLVMLETAVVHNWLTVYAPKPDELPAGTGGTRVVEEEGVTYI